MSKFTGKYDCYDWFVDNSEEFISKSTFKIGNEVLNINCRKDLIPYYPFLIISAGRDKEKCTVYLTEESYIDIEEREHLSLYMDIVKDYFKKCNGNFNKEEAYKILMPYDWDREYAHKIVERVAKYGSKADISGLHTPSHERLREEFCAYMIKNGYDVDFTYKWVFKEKWYDKKEKSKNKETGKDKE